MLHVQPDEESWRPRRLAAPPACLGLLARAGCFPSKFAGGGGGGRVGNPSPHRITIGWTSACHAAGSPVGAPLHRPKIQARPLAVPRIEIVGLPPVDPFLLRLVAPPFLPARANGAVAPIPPPPPPRAVALGILMRCPLIARAEEARRGRRPVSAGRAQTPRRWARAEGGRPRVLLAWPHVGQIAGGGAPSPPPLARLQKLPWLGCWIRDQGSDGPILSRA